MPDHFEEADHPVEAGDLPQTGAAALTFALDGARDEPGLVGPIAEFLKQQRALIADQRHHLGEQLKRLRVSTLDERLSVALKIMTGVVGLAVALGLGWTVWDASAARGLVVEGFSAPPDFVEQGVGGDVVAQDITAKLMAIRRFAMEHSYSTSNDVTKSGGDIKVEIPETGISISEVLRALRGWLGHERHVTGSLRELPDGRIGLGASLDGGDNGAVTIDWSTLDDLHAARLDADTMVSVTGTQSDLDRMEQQAAEAIFARFDPVNYVNYLAARGRYQDAMAAAARYVPAARTPAERADAFSLWSYTTAYATGDLGLASGRAGIAIEIDPKLAVAHIQLARFADYVGHDEALLSQARLILTLSDGDQLPAHHGHGFAEMQDQARHWISRLLGDYENAADWDCAHDCPLSHRLVSKAQFAARRHDSRTGRALLQEAHAAGLEDPVALAEARYYLDAGNGNWTAALADAQAAGQNRMLPQAEFIAIISPRFLAETRAAHYLPLVAYAQSHLGDLAHAHATIDATPVDCYDCVRTRGIIDDYQRNWGGAAFWFATAVKLAPSLPLAYFDWGRMLLLKGDIDGAIAKFAVAHAKGPHFADPLEAWGEALMAKNRSDLALDKFAEAARYAPNWGRLHLKRGEALWWTGRKVDARASFARAAALDLTAHERRELASFR